MYYIRYVHVVVNLPKSYVPTADMYEFYIKVKDDGEWVSVPARYKVNPTEDKTLPLSKINLCSGKS